MTIRIKCVNGVWMPAGERILDHIVTVGPMRDGRATYQIRKFDAAVRRVKTNRRRRALDVGGHVGMWAREMARMFDHVESFEPVPLHRECFMLNCQAGNVTLHPHAIGAEPDFCSMFTPPDKPAESIVVKSMETRVAPGHGDVPILPLDAMAYDDVDFLKIDVEGYEEFVIRGAEETIKRNRPVIIVEQKNRDVETFGSKIQNAAGKLLIEWGMRCIQEIQGDWILIWR